MVFAFGGSLLVVALFQPMVDFFAGSVALPTAYQLTMVVIGSIAVGFFLLTFSWTREHHPPKEQKTT